MCYYGNGFTQMDVYRLPIHLRNFYYRMLGDAKQKESEQIKKANDASSKKVRIKK